MDPGLVAPLVKPPNPLMSDVLRLQEPSPNALGDYVSCGLAKNGELWPDARKRCEELRASLYKGPVLPHVPTEAEELAARRFAHDKVVQGTPVLVPCFSPVIIGVSPICLINGLLNGFDVENAVYPEVGRPPSRREGLSRRAPLPDNMRR